MEFLFNIIWLAIVIKIVLESRKSSKNRTNSTGQNGHYNMPRNQGMQPGNDAQSRSVYRETENNRVHMLHEWKPGQPQTELEQYRQQAGAGQYRQQAGAGQYQPQPVSEVYRKQTFSGNQRMTLSEQNKLKDEIRQRLKKNVNLPNQHDMQTLGSREQQPPVMQTLNHEEYHSPVMQAGSTGTYSDMQGGKTFSQYDCGHDYNDAIVPETPVIRKNKPNWNEMFRDRTSIQKAFIMQELLTRKGA